PSSTASDATSCRSPAPSSPTASTQSRTSDAGAHEVNRMTIEKADHAREKGIALVYVGIFLVPLLLCTGLAVDLGWGYLVRATLAKAVDAAALAAARNMTADSSQAQRAGNNIFNANFPAGYLGVSPDPPQIDTDGRGSDGSYIIKVSSKATMPTTFMRIANFDTLT